MNETHAKLTKRGDLIEIEPKPEYKVDLEAQRWSFEEKRQQREQHKTWDSCCLPVEKNMAVDITQTLFSFYILVFCAFMLHSAQGDRNRASPYLSIVSFLLGKLLSSDDDEVTI